jgi:hypothetical protein
MSFDEYLLAKKINLQAFQVGNPQQFSQWQHAFTHLHPDSFTEQFKFQINQTRRLYPLTENV